MKLREPGAVKRRALVISGLIVALPLPWQKVRAAATTVVRRRQVLEIVTLNDKSGVGSDIVYASTFAQVLFLQEVGNLNVANVLKGWTVCQDMSNAVTSGAAIAIRPGVRFRVSLSKYIVLVPSHQEGNGIAVVRGTFYGTPMEFISAHRPREKRSDLWPVYDAALAAYVQGCKDRGNLVVIGIDANDGIPQGLADELKLAMLTPYDTSLDMFMLSGTIVTNGVTTMLRRTSDHHAVLAVLRVQLK